MHAKSNGLAALEKGYGQSNGQKSVAGDVESQQVTQGASHGMVLPFLPVTVTFRNIRYFVPIPEVPPLQ